MSGPAPSRQMSLTKEIPTRTVTVSDQNQMPSSYCTTPGGTIFATTPGGTRIIYERQFLLHLRNSPLAQTPPANLPHIPGITGVSVKQAPSPGPSVKTNGRAAPNENREPRQGDSEEPQFEMDI